jgi:hypothetical protein
MTVGDWIIGSTLRQSWADLTAAVNIFRRQQPDVVFSKSAVRLARDRRFRLVDPDEAERVRRLLRSILEEAVAEDLILDEADVKDRIGSEQAEVLPLPSELEPQPRLTLRDRDARLRAAASAAQEGEPSRLAIRLAVTSVVLGLAIYAIITHNGVDPAWGGIGTVVGYWLR